MKTIKNYLYMDLENSFDISGLFYDLKSYKCRKYLNIIKKGSNLSTPDLMVIMMNPGSSKPISNDESNNIEVKTKPDRTQFQIMKIMKSCNFNYARILNLSDLRESKSKFFYEKNKSLDNEIAHSIFIEQRKDDIEKLYVKNIPVICAWGVNKNLGELAKMALDKIKDENKIGWKKECTDYAYYHPLPRNLKKQEEWVSKIISLFKN